MDGVDDNDEKLGVLTFWDVDSVFREERLLSIAAKEQSPVLIWKYRSLYERLGIYPLAEALSTHQYKQALEHCLSLNNHSRLIVATFICSKDPRLAATLPEAIFPLDDRLTMVKRMARNASHVLPQLMQYIDVPLGGDRRLALTKEVAMTSPHALGNLGRALRLPRKEIEWILEEAGDTPVQKTQMASLGIKGIFGRPPAEVFGPASLELNPLYAKSIEEAGQRAEDISRRLTDAIKRNQPERSAKEDERTRVEQVMRRPFKTIAELGTQSATAPLIVTIEGKLLPCVYKPAVREPFGARVGIRQGEGILREWLAAQVDKALGLDLVPATILRNGPAGVGSVQDWKIGDTGMTVPREQISLSARMRISVFDALITHSDRHHQNYLLSPDGEIHGIDNGYSLSRTPDMKYEGLRCFPAEGLEKTPIPKEFRDRLYALRTSPEILYNLYQAFQFCFGPDTNMVWNGFMTRLHTLDPDDPFKPSHLPPVAWHAFTPLP